MGESADLFARCHVNKNDDGDRFVGIKADSDNAMVYFPLGYQLLKMSRSCVKTFSTLFLCWPSLLTEKIEFLLCKNLQHRNQLTFLLTYMEVISYFMEQNGYYSEKEPVFRNGDRGKIDWMRTLRTKKPLIQSNGTPAYTEYTVRCSSPNDKNLITQIHKFCVYESFSKLGWLFTPYLPERPTIRRNDKEFLYVLRSKLSNTFNDKDKRLFSSMIAMIEYLDAKSEEKQFYFGTDHFENVWEKLIDRVFGVRDKHAYFPRTRWTLKTGKTRTNAALEPDSIMLHDGKIYVLDAKYYKFGLTGNPKDLPESSSINKQITYGEYIHTQRRFGKCTEKMW